MSVSEVRERLGSNLKRVESLVKLFDDVESSGSPTKTDLLRAAVVFLHATLEDVVRSALELELPNTAREHLSMLQFAVGSAKKDKITVTELAAHRGKTVDELIRERINAYLERSNFNNVADLDTALARMALDTSMLDPYRGALDSIMKRRHWIVHRADYNEGAAGPGHGQPLPISLVTVTGWRNAVTKFCSKLLDTLSQP